MKSKSIPPHFFIELIPFFGFFSVDDPPCQILDPIESPDIEGYRTKCEFSIGKNPLGEPTIGFLQGLYRDGLTNVLEPSESIHVPEISKQIVKSMQEYIRTSSTLPVYDRVLKTGVWRSLMVKAQSTGDGKREETCTILFGIILTF
jgi:tRNA (uracil-5-)-methyltransferase